MPNSKTFYYYITYEGGSCYYFSEEKPVWDAGKNTWDLPGGSLAWIEAYLFEQIYPEAAALLIPATTPESGMIKVRVEKGLLTIIPK